MEIIIPKELGIYKINDLFIPQTKQDINSLELLISHSRNIFIEFTNDMKFSVQRIPGLPNRYGPYEHPWSISGIQTEGLCKDGNVRWSVFVERDTIEDDPKEENEFDFVINQTHKMSVQENYKRSLDKHNKKDKKNKKDKDDIWESRETYKANRETRTIHDLTNGSIVTYSTMSHYNSSLDFYRKRDKKHRKNNKKEGNKTTASTKEIKVIKIDPKQYNYFDYDDSDNYFGNRQYQSYGYNAHSYGNWNKWSKYKTKSTTELLLHEVRHIKQAITIRKAIADAGFNYIEVDRIKRFLDNAYIHGDGGSHNPKTSLGKILEGVESDANRCMNIDEWINEEKGNAYLFALYTRVLNEVSTNKDKWKARVGFNIKE